MSSSKLPFPLWAVALGGIGCLLLAFGLLGLVNAAPFPILEDRTVAIALVVLGALLLVVEAVVIIGSIRARAQARR